jgi:hypothetical protein
MKTVTGGSGALLLALLMHGHTVNARAACESLSSLALPNTSITLAQMVPAGGFTLPGNGCDSAAIQPVARLASALQEALE